MNLSPHFQLSEFTVSQTAQRLGLDNTPSPEVIANLRAVAFWLEGVRKILGAPILVTSGYRSPEVNKAVSGSLNSDHCLGLAVDWHCPGFGTPERIMRVLAAEPWMKWDQLILEFPPNGWIHTGLGPRNRRQLLRIDSSGTSIWRP